METTADKAARDGEKRTEYDWYYPPENAVLAVLTRVPEAAPVVEAVKVQVAKLVPVMVYP